jgi:hypothetical protein
MESFWGNLGTIELSPRRREKLGEELTGRPYRRPTQVGGGKYLKADGRTLVKELGNLTP